MVVTVDDRHSLSMEFAPLDVFRWEKCEVDASGVTTHDELMERFANQACAAVKTSDGRPLAMRVEFRGITQLDAALKQDVVHWTQQVRAAAFNFAAGQIWIEKVKFHTTGPGQALRPDHLQGPIGELSNLIREMKGDPAALEQLSTELSDLRGKLPPEVKDRAAGLRLGSPEHIASLLEEVESLLIGRLVVGGQKQ
jgi:hypothetical protein